MEAIINIPKIERLQNLSDEQFYNEYVKKSLPVVIRDKAQWTALEQFTPEYLIANYNHLTRTIDGTTYTLSEIIDLCKKSTAENKAPYPNVYDLDHDFPELKNDIPEMYYGKSNRLRSSLLPGFIAKRTNQRQLFFGGKGCSFPTLHIDYLGVHTQLTQVIGEKEFILYSPDQTAFLYPDEKIHTHSPVNIMEPDLSKYPLFKNAKPLKITLKPGETLFIPSGWWHTTYIHNFNLTYAIDHVNAFNWNTFMDESYIAAKQSYPKLAWGVKLYKLIMGHIFNIKESLFSK